MGGGALSASQALGAKVSGVLWTKSLTWVQLRSGSLFEVCFHEEFANFLRTYCDCFELPVYWVTAYQEYKMPSKVRNDGGGLLRQSASRPKHQARE